VLNKGCSALEARAIVDIGRQFQSFGHPSVGEVSWRRPDELADGRGRAARSRASAPEDQRARANVRRLLPEANGLMVSRRWSE
jgi:hypothetical protein